MERKHKECVYKFVGDRQIDGAAGGGGDTEANKKTD
jgi:hypothetical protein